MGDEAEQRTAVVAEARSWLRTPYRNQAFVKGLGVDCGFLLIEVYAACGLIERFDPRPYSDHWHLHRSEERYLGWVERFAHPVAQPGPGDVVLWRLGRCFSHGGIVTEWPAPGVGAGRPGAPQRVVHAYARARMVEESDVAIGGELSDPKRERRYFSLWGAG
jgi:hypothetical protein